jgi:hypothetical protein
MTTEEKISNIFADVKTILFRLNEKDKLCSEHSLQLQKIKDSLLIEGVKDCFKTKEEETKKKAEEEFRQKINPVLNIYRDWKGFWATLLVLASFISTTSYIIVKVNAITKSVQLNTVNEVKIKEEIKNQLEKDLKELLSKNTTGAKEP